MKNFNVSVIIPVYNASPYIECAVASALQFEVVKEIILIEDNSPDNSLEVCHKIVEQNRGRVKLFRHPNGENLGAGASRNVGIRHASQEYLAFLDADDQFLLNRFEGEIYTLGKQDFEGMHGGLGIFFHGNAVEKEYAHLFTGKENIQIYGSPDASEVFDILIGIKGKGLGYFSLDTLTIKRNSLDKMDSHFDQELRLHQDTEFLIRLAYHADLIKNPIKEPIAIRGVHEANRITQVKYRTKKFYSNQVLLWRSLQNWAFKNQIPYGYKKYITRKVMAFKIAESSPVKAWRIFVVCLFKDFKIIKEFRIYLKNLLLVE